MGVSVYENSVSSVLLTLRGHGEPSSTSQPPMLEGDTTITPVWGAIWFVGSKTAERSEQGHPDGQMVGFQVMIAGADCGADACDRLRTLTEQNEKLQATTKMRMLQSPLRSLEKNAPHHHPYILAEVGYEEGRTNVLRRGPDKPPQE